MSSVSSSAIRSNIPNGTFLIRILDILLSSIGLFIASPFILIIMILIKIQSKGPAFFTQGRLGLNKQPFTLIKFRSMKIDAEKSGPEWSKKNDPRITKIGRWLRKTHLDELPQLLNVLRGELCLVGPRPIRAHFADILQENNSAYNQRFLSKPGITGWAQVYAPYGTTIEEQLEKLPYDLKYLDNFSLKHYFSIIIVTAKVVFLGKGI